MCAGESGEFDQVSLREEGPLFGEECLRRLKQREMFL